MKKINFFSKFHNGDLFTSKGFVQNTILNDQLKDFEFGYYHSNHVKVLKDLNIKHLGPSRFGDAIRFVEEGDTLNINTWIGCYCSAYNSEPPEYQIPGTGINIPVLHSVWSFIYEKINSYFGTSIKLKDNINHYIPQIDYSQFNIDNHKKFIQDKIGEKNILFCNGTVHSSQSTQSDLCNVVEYFAKKYPQHNYICTKKINLNLPNVFFTDDIQVPFDEIYNANIPWNDRNDGVCDLNEISYLSTYCDIIVGKNSGPFLFCTTKENLSTEGKVIISFNNVMSCGLGYGVDLECEWIYSNMFEFDSIVSIIEEKICEL